jgi:hypothetical protein
MSDLVPVHAGWAIWSKHPGTHDDYSVLASSAGPLSTAEFTRVLMHFAPGNPPAETGAPASLPWVMLSRVGVADQTYLGASVQVPTDYVDGTGRPVSRTSYICVPYEEVARAPVSYRGMSSALRSAQLPYQDGALVPLTIPRLDPQEMAQTVMEFGPHTVATTAALLLSGPVTITGPEFPDTETRLRFLDAVAALLPYGYRTSYTAATWSDTAASAQRFRLVFAVRARDASSRVTWRAAAPVPDEGSARRYLEHLQRVLGRPAVDLLELASLISYLSSDTRPRKFEQAEQAVASLYEFFRAAAVGDTIDAGSATAADIRLLFCRGQDSQLSPNRRRKALGLLIADGDAQDWPLVNRCFGAIAEGDPHSMLPAMAKAARRLLWSRAPKDQVRAYLRLMTSYGLSDALLARLMPEPESAADLVDGLDTAAALLAELVMENPASYLQTRQALAHNPAVGTALIANLCASRGSGGVSPAIEWLEPALDRILPAFNAVLGDVPEPVDLAALQALDLGGGHLSVRCLVRGAFYLKRLPLVLPALALWLAWNSAQQGTQGTQAVQDRRFWNDMAMELTPATVIEAAWLDLTLLATGNDPRSLFAGRFHPSQLSQCLDATWRELISRLGNHGQVVDEFLVSVLIDFLGRRRWRGDQEQTAVVSDLTSWLTADGARPRLKMAVQDPAEALRQLPPQATAVQIAEICARACVGGLTAGQAGEALAQSRVIVSGAQAANVLEHLVRVLPAAVTANGQQPPAAWAIAFAGKLASGAFGQPIAEEFSTIIANSSIAELNYRLALLYIVAGSGADESPPAVNDQGVDDLVKVSRGDIDELVQKIRKRQRKHKIPGWKGGGE